MKHFQSLRTYNFVILSPSTHAVRWPGGVSAAECGPLLVVQDVRTAAMTATLPLSHTLLTRT